ncbi:MAG: amidohydrolase, partial [Thermoprotei archaeon]
MRILLKNVRVPLTGNTTSEAVIIIEDGVISGISKTAPPLQGFDEIIDGGGGIAVPGAIDIHAHIYDPDYTHHEDFATGSIAAAFGGITTFYDMPLRLYVDSIERLKLKIEAGLKDSFINFSIIAGMMNEANLSSA